MPYICVATASRTLLAEKLDCLFGRVEVDPITLHGAVLQAGPLNGGVTVILEKFLDLVVDDLSGHAALLDMPSGLP